MSIFHSIGKYLVYVFLFTFVGIFFSFFVNAQVGAPPAQTELATIETPNFDFLVSWTATNYVPSDFKGKILPSKNSPVQISFDVLDGNKFVNIANQQVDWYLNDSLIKSGVGLKSIVFIPTRNTSIIDIVIPAYTDAKYNAAEINTVITIPMATPEVVIHAPYANKNISLGDNVFQVLPYFFNISNVGQLKVDWEIDGVKNSGEANRPDILNLTATSQGEAAAGANIGIKAFVQNLANQFEFAQNYINLNIK